MKLVRKIFFILNLLPFCSKAQSVELPLGGSVSSNLGSMVFTVGEIANELVQSGGHNGKYGIIQLMEWNQREIISGNLKYANTALTPMTNSSLNFIRGNQASYTANTGSTGNIYLTNVDRGLYSLQLQTNKPWGGVNATDAILINNHFTNINLLSNINLKAADVNASGTVTSADALQVMQRFVNQRSSFAAGDFILNNDSFNVVEGMGSVNIESRVLSFGDVNGSYVPNISLREEWVDFDLVNEPIIVGNEINEIPIFVLSDCMPSAVSLSIKLPEGVIVEGVRTSEALNAAALVFKQDDDILRVGWYDLSNIELTTGSILGYLKVRGKISEAWRVGNETEIADKFGNVNSNVKLGLPKFSAPKLDISAIVFPNPSSNKQYLIINGKKTILSAKLFDMNGKVIKSYPSHSFDVLGVSVDLDVENLAAGSYDLRLESIDLDGTITLKSVKILRN